MLHKQQLLKVTPCSMCATACHAGHSSAEVKSCTEKAGLLGLLPDLSPGSGLAEACSGCSLLSGVGLSAAAGIGSSAAAGVGPSAAAGTDPSAAAGIGPSATAGTGPSATAGTGPSATAGTEPSAAAGVGPSETSTSNTAILSQASFEASLEACWSHD